MQSTWIRTVNGKLYPDKRFTKYGTAYQFQNRIQELVSCPSREVECKWPESENDTRWPIPRLFLESSSVDEGSGHQGGSRLCDTLRLCGNCGRFHSAGATTGRPNFCSSLELTKHLQTTHGGVARLSYGNAFSQKQRV